MPEALTGINELTVYGRTKHVGRSCLKADTGRLYSVNPPYLSSVTGNDGAPRRQRALLQPCLPDRAGCRAGSDLFILRVSGWFCVTGSPTCKGGRNEKVHHRVNCRRSFLRAVACPVGERDYSSTG